MKLQPNLLNGNKPGHCETPVACNMQVLLFLMHLLWNITVDSTTPLHYEILVLGIF